MEKVQNTNQLMKNVLLHEGREYRVAQLSFILCVPILILRGNQ